MSDAVKGMLLMLAGTFVLTTQDGLSKWLIAHYHAGEVMVYRGIWVLPVLALAIWSSRAPNPLRPMQLRVNLIRGALALVTSVLVVISFAHMPLADALAVIFLSPLMMTALSVPMLGERVVWRRWMAVGVGFAGVLFIAKPGTTAFTLWALVPLAAAATSALRDILTRRLGQGQGDAATTVLFYTAVITVAGGAASLPLAAHWPTLPHWGVFALAGVLFALANVLMIKAFQYAMVSELAPLKYLSLAWAAMLGYWIWGDVPDTPKIFGAALVAAAGLYTLRREKAVAVRSPST